MFSIRKRQGHPASRRCPWRFFISRVSLESRLQAWYALEAGVFHYRKPLADGSPRLENFMMAVRGGNPFFQKKVLSLPPRTNVREVFRDVAQLVACNVRDVEVASSNLVIPTKQASLAQR